MSVETQNIIRPILVKVYGDGAMVRNLAIYLADKIDTFEPAPDALEDENRENMIRLTCWNWFSGGGTAELVANRIETALEAS